MTFFIVVTYDLGGQYWHQVAGLSIVPPHFTPSALAPSTQNPVISLATLCLHCLPVWRSLMQQKFPECITSFAVSLTKCFFVPEHVTLHVIICFFWLQLSDTFVKLSLGEMMLK